MASEPIFADVPEWPQRLPPRDHNRPPVEEEAKAAFRDALLTDRPDFERLLEDLIGAADRVPTIEDDETCGRAGDLLKRYRAAAGHISEAHTKAKEPFLKGGRAVDAEKNELIGRLDTARGKVLPKVNTYVAEKEARERAERDRIIAEQRKAAEEAAKAERERAAAERARLDALRAGDEAAAAAIVVPESAPAMVYQAPQPARSPIRSDAGATVSGRTVWQSRVVDYGKAFKLVKGDTKVREAIDAAIQRLVKAGQRDIAGVEVFETTQAIAR